LLPCGQFVVPEGDVLVGKAREHMQRRGEAQQFFGRGCDPVGGQKGGIGFVFQQGFDRVSDAVDGCFVSGVQQQDAGADQLIRREPFAVLFCRDQV